MVSTGGGEVMTTVGPGGSPVTCSPAPRLAAGALVIPPFQVSFQGQRFVQWETMRIELAELAPDRYRIVVVQNFWTEDPNPDLSQCLAGIFLSRRRRDGAWEVAENWPVECRTVAHIGVLDLRRPAHPRLVVTRPC